jgi:hypothetical protein
VAKLIRPSFVFFFHPDYTGHQQGQPAHRDAIRHALEERFHATLRRANIESGLGAGERIKNVQSLLCAQRRPQHDNGEIYLFLPDKRIELEIVLSILGLMWESLTTRPLIVGEPVLFYGCGFRDVPDDITS